MNQKPPPSPIFKKFPLKPKLDTISASSSSALQTPRSESPTFDGKGKSPVRFSGESLQDVKQEDFSPIRKKSSKKRENSTPIGYSSDSNLIESATSKSPSDVDKGLKKKKKRVHVVSPLTGEKVYVSSEDLIKSRKSKTLSSKSESGEMISSIENLRETFDDDVIVPVEDRTEVLFVSDGKQYKPKDLETIKMEKEEIAKFAQQKKSSDRFADVRIFIYDSGTVGGEQKFLIFVLQFMQGFVYFQYFYYLQNHCLFPLFLSSLQQLVPYSPSLLWDT